MSSRSKAQWVLDARAGFPGATLADLYDPLAMPPALAAAHAALDRAVDKCYRPAEFPSDRDRVEYLFQLYEQLHRPARPHRESQADAQSMNDAFSLTPSLSRWERRQDAPRLGEGRARDRSVERDDLQTGAETDSLSQRANRRSPRA